MVRVIVLALLLTACTSNQIKYGKEVAAPYGWQQWCDNNPTDKDCHLK
jgi:hypothetical protein